MQKRNIPKFLKILKTVNYRQYQIQDIVLYLNLLSTEKTNRRREIEQTKSYCAYRHDRGFKKRIYIHKSDE